MALRPMKVSLKVKRQGVSSPDTYMSDGEDLAPLTQGASGCGETLKGTQEYN